MKLRSNKEVANFISFLAMYKSTDLFHLAHKERPQN